MRNVIKRTAIMMKNEIMDLNNMQYITKVRTRTLKKHKRKKATIDQECQNSDDTVVYQRYRTARTNAHKKVETLYENIVQTAQKFIVATAEYQRWTKTCFSEGLNIRETEMDFIFKPVELTESDGEGIEGIV